MKMIFYEKDKILSFDEPIKFTKSDFYPKPSIGGKVVINEIIYTVCDIIINYDEYQIIVIIDKV